MVPSITCDAPRHVPWHSRVLRHPRETLRALEILAVLLLCAVAAAWTDARLGERLGRVDSAELVYLPPPAFLKTVSFGYRRALADVLWFRAISYFGKHYRSDRVYTWLAHMCDVVTDLDPRAEHVYRFGGVILPWEADRIDDGIALLEKGTRNIPDSWRLHYMLGFSYYFFKNDLAAAGHALETGMRLPGAPEFVSRLTATIMAADRGPDAAAAFLAEVERTAPSEEMRGAIRQRIQELGLVHSIDQIENGLRTFRERTGHLPAALEELVTTGILSAIPPDPFGGHYVFDPHSGEVQSSIGGAARRMGSSNMRKAFLSGKQSGVSP